MTADDERGRVACSLTWWPRGPSHDLRVLRAPLSGVRVARFGLALGDRSLWSHEVCIVCLGAMREPVLP